ncbi:aldose 1-epimerase-like [Panicum miliaceum]|uniref:Aldose 1-epimerase-like n=1 Tax=Panicum miliaceum TaxID=4540 RepID=A0A3L6QAF5_PANMI|nr:aldose 1-epimerase-like [Panicum miliaceum]
MASPARRLLLATLCVAASLLGLGAQAAAGAGARRTAGVYELRMGDFSVRVTNWGARLVSVVLPDSKGNLADVVLGKDTIAEYVPSNQVVSSLATTQNDTSYFGPITGRVGQRISRGRFVLDGEVYHLERNDGRNTLRGGGTAFSRSAWTVKEYVGGGDSPRITFFYRSFDGEQGFPGSLDAHVTYRLSSP